MALLAVRTLLAGDTALNRRTAMSNPPVPEEVRIVRANVELRDVDAVGTGPPYRYIEGRAVPFNTWADVGPYLEQHAVGSFERSTKGGSGRSLPLLPWHDN